MSQAKTGSERLTAGPLLKGMTRPIAYANSHSKLVTPSSRLPLPLSALPCFRPCSGSRVATVATLCVRFFFKLSNDGHIVCAFCFFRVKMGPQLSKLYHVCNNCILLSHVPRVVYNHMKDTS